ncbi:hypothetical protein ACF09K_15365 [Streptomyces sp. NPDC014882]|uniref:hypothetical protein n=1 Tax=Streptomyces sp. NPDC014882 TaxID=3364927 RepID=UPI0037025D8B
MILRPGDEHGKWAVADAYDISTVPAFMARWWGEYAIARDGRLDALVTDLEHRAADSTDLAEAKRLLEEVSHLRYEAQRLEPGQRPVRGSWARPGRRTGPSRPRRPAMYCRSACGR